MRHLPRPAAVPLRPHRVVLCGALARGEVVTGLLEAQGGVWLWLFVGGVYGSWADGGRGQVREDLGIGLPGFLPESEGPQVD